MDSLFEEEIMMNKRFVRFLLAAVLAVIVLLTPTSALAAATVSQGTREEQLSLSMYVPCANGGAGEYVDFQITLKSTFRVVLDDTGGYHHSERYSYRGTGTGRITGTQYRLSGEENYKYMDKVGVLETYIWTWKVSGPSGTSNFLLRGNLHMVVHPDGTITVDRNDITTVCL
jgi:hypothetical protein